VGLIVDSNVFIQFERRKLSVDFSPWADSDDDVFLSAITVSELLVGVSYANTDERRRNRSEFVEAIIAGITILDFSTAIARRHAQVHANLARKGQLIGPHDMIIAATALHYGLSLLTDNVAEFSRVDGLIVVGFAS
jgi:predicted nucleic acid-binding protein